MGIALEAIYDRISPYPPQPDRMRAKTFNGYVRGIGVFPKSAFFFSSEDQLWQRRPRISKATRAKIRYTSQQMSKKWRLTVVAAADGTGVTGTLANLATYSGWVVGPLDTAKRPHQAAWHTLTGWPNSDDSIKAAQPDISAAFGAAMDQIIKILVDS